MKRFSLNIIAKLSQKNTSMIVTVTLVKCTLLYQAVNPACLEGQQKKDVVMVTSANSCS
jgi:hypothetical protein